LYLIYMVSLVLYGTVLADHFISNMPLKSHWISFHVVNVCLNYKMNSM
jgi:hypothetical protein